MDAVCRVIVFGFLLPVFLSCSAVNGLAHYFKSTGHFKAWPADERVLFEEGGEDFAETLAALIPAAIKTVEQVQYGTFQKGIRVYVCATPESFEDLTGRKVKALAYRESVFLSPRLLDNPEDVPAYLTHELSHLFMLQYRGLYGFMTTPPWFNEGLAVYVSKGAGAGSVSEEEAVKAMLSGKAFEPDNAGGILDFLFPKYGSHWNLKPHMFCRQASLFVAFMKEHDNTAFEKMLAAMQHDQSFREAFRQAYGVSIPELWGLFFEQLKTGIEEQTGNESTDQASVSGKE